MFKFLKSLWKSFKTRKNTGHMLGNDLTGMPENSLASLNKAISKKYQEREDFLYWEFDICEIRNEIVGFHDCHIKKHRIGRMIPSPAHVVKWKMQDLNWQQVKRLRLKGSDECPPTLKMILDGLNGVVTKDVAVEVKHLHSKTGIRKLIKHVSAFKISNPNVDTYFKCRRTRYKSVFKKKDFSNYFHIKIKKAGLELK